MNEKQIPFRQSLEMDCPDDNNDGDGLNESAASQVIQTPGAITVRSICAA